MATDSQWISLVALWISPGIWRQGKLGCCTPSIHIVRLYLPPPLASRSSLQVMASEQMYIFFTLICDQEIFASSYAELLLYTLKCYLQSSMLDLLNRDNRSEARSFWIKIRYRAMFLDPIRILSYIYCLCVFYFSHILDHNVTIDVLDYAQLKVLVPLTIICSNISAIYLLMLTQYL